MKLLRELLNEATDAEKIKAKLDELEAIRAEVKIARKNKDPNLKKLTAKMAQMQVDFNEAKHLVNGTPPTKSARRKTNREAKQAKWEAEFGKPAPKGGEPEVNAAIKATEDRKKAIKKNAEEEAEKKRAAKDD